MEQKYIYYLQHGETGRIISNKFTLSQIEDGRFLTWFSTVLDRYFIIARMPYTNVNDINNQELYNGDIILFEECHGGPEHTWMEQKAKEQDKVIDWRRPRIVYWNEKDARWYLQGRYTVDVPLYMEFNNKYIKEYGIEKIGNNYENPELAIY